MKLRYLFLSAVVMLAPMSPFSQVAWCDEGDHYNRVTYISDATRKVDNDLLTAQVSVEINDKDPARIAQQITATLKEALKTADAFKAVKVSTGYQNTEPVYGKNEKLIGYRGHAELRLESRDFEAASKLIARLQNKMQLTGVSFSIAPETRKQVETGLTAEAIAAFRKQADAVRATLDGKSWKLVRLNINQQADGYDTLRVSRGDGLAKMKFYANNVSNQPLSGGQGEIAVYVTGTIEIAP